MKKKILILLVGIALAISMMGALSACDNNGGDGGNGGNGGNSGCEHEWQDANCTAPKTCKKCNATEGSVKAHAEAILGAKAPTCAATGLTEGKQCMDCGTITVPQQTIPAKGHKYSPTTGVCETCNESNPESTEYTVMIKSIGGLPLKSTAFVLVDESGNTVELGFTGDDGTVRFLLDTAQTYTFKFHPSFIPAGYIVDTEGYRLITTVTNIQLVPKVIPSDSESDYKNVSYNLGDVMYDFSFKNLNGDTVRLTELLSEQGGKKGVLLNFFFTTCSPCRAEFPYIQSVYEKYRDEISVIAINPTGETDAVISAFLMELGLTFDVVNGGAALAQAFGVTAYPTSVFIDRYGTITFLESGSLPSERPFQALFSKAVAEDYTQVIYNNVDELLPREEVDIEMESSADINKVLSPGDITVEYYPETDSEDAIWSWPFQTTEAHGYECIKPTNSFKPSSYSLMYADVTFNLDVGDALIFDYWSSTEAGSDKLVVLVNGVDIIQISGDNNEWRTACAYVALESGIYTVAFVYQKDGDVDGGEDAVYIKNLRIENNEKINTPTYIQREAATNPDEMGDGFEDYVEIFMGDDGYYHVGSKTGPLLLAKLNSYTPFSYENSVFGYAIDGQIQIDGKDYYEDLVKFFSYGARSDIYYFCPVNDELKKLLEIVAIAVGTGDVNPNDWLEICVYYDAYATDGKQLENPIKGLGTECAFDTVVNKETDPDDLYPNVVNYTKLLNPRGLFYEFIPTVSGVYLIESNSDQALLGWIFNEDREILMEYEPLERYLQDFDNVYMYMYFEAGTKYYINIAFHDVNTLGAFSFKIDYVGETHKIFAAGSQTFFTYALDEMGEVTDILIAGGIDVKLGDDGYYHHVLPDGTLGSIVYADFVRFTNAFLENAIYNPDPKVVTLLSAGVFDFSKTENDDYALARGWDKMSDDDLRAIWGENFDYNYELYKITDLREGKYHGKGTDYTERILWYAQNKMYTGADDNFGVKTDDANLLGCVPVDAELAAILQLVMDKMLFKAENSWTKLSYYYLEFGPAKTAE